MLPDCARLTGGCAPGGLRGAPVVPRGDQRGGEREPWDPACRLDNVQTKTDE